MATRLVALSILAAAALTPTAAAAEPVSLTLELPLTDGQSAVETAIAGFGGTVTGGEFSAAGWTTTSRDDIIVVPLPPGIDASQGVLSVTVDNLEFPAFEGYFDSYHLVSLDASGPPFRPTQAGDPGLQSLAAIWRETGEDLGRGRFYFNLADSGCTDWRNCTGEGGTGRGFLAPNAEFTWTHTWDGNVDLVRIQGPNNMRNDAIDLGATSPMGRIEAPQLYLSVNACGGSTHNSCGQWDGPRKGGPLGVTYQVLTLTLTTECGDGVCAEYFEDCNRCAADCGMCPVEMCTGAECDATDGVNPGDVGSAGDVDGPVADASTDTSTTASDAMPTTAMDTMVSSDTDGSVNTATDTSHGGADATPNGDVDAVGATEAPMVDGDGESDGCGCRQVSSGGRGRAPLALGLSLGLLLWRRRHRRLPPQT